MGIIIVTTLNENVFILMKLSSHAVVTTSSSANVKYSHKMTTFSLQWNARIHKTINYHRLRRIT